MAKLQGYAKVNKTVGGGMVKVGVFNPTTKDYKEIIVDDLEYGFQGGFTSAEFTSTELIQLQEYPINTTVLALYNDFIGYIVVGSTIEVFKGRKVKIGTIGKVTAIVENTYNYHTTTNVILSDGQKTNINNCKIYREV